MNSACALGYPGCKHSLTFVRWGVDTVATGYVVFSTCKPNAPFVFGHVACAIFGLFACGKASHANVHDGTSRLVC